MSKIQIRLDILTTMIAALPMILGQTPPTPAPSENKFQPKDTRTKPYDKQLLCVSNRF